MRAFILGHVSHTSGEKYDEYEFTATTGERVRVHVGDTEWVIVQGIKAGLSALNELRLSLADVIAEFTAQSLTCRCGCRSLAERRGELGETLRVCPMCDDVVSVDCCFT